MRSNSDLEDEIGVGPLRTSRTKLGSNSDLEDEITSDLEDEIGIPRTKLESLRTKLESPRTKLRSSRKKLRCTSGQGFRQRDSLRYPKQHRFRAAGRIFVREIVFDIPNMMDLEPPAEFLPGR